MHNLKGVKAGDELVWTRDRRRHGNNPRPSKTLVVDKVGTKLVHAKMHGHPTAYRIENGIGRDPRDGILWKPEDWALEGERPDLEETLRRKGVEVWRTTLSIPTLKGFLAVLEEAEL